MKSQHTRVVRLTFLALLVGGCGSTGAPSGRPTAAPTIVQAAGQTPAGTTTGLVTQAPAPSEEPAPTEVAPTVPAIETPPPAAFETIVLSGKGNKVKKFSIPEDSAAIAVVKETGSSNFVIWSLASDGSENDLLVNEIGNYSGTVLFDADTGEHSVAFKIESNGSWKITIKPITAARRWNGTSALTGKGDDVVFVSPPSADFTIVTLKHSGNSNFAIWAYGDETDLIVNDIGKFNGETILPSGTILLEVTANGAWSVTPS